MSRRPSSPQPAQPAVTVREALADAFDVAACTCPTAEHAARHIERALREAGYVIRPAEHAAQSPQGHL